MEPASAAAALCASAAAVAVATAAATAATRAALAAAGGWHAVGHHVSEPVCRAAAVRARRWLGRHQPVRVHRLRVVGARHVGAGVYI